MNSMCILFLLKCAKMYKRSKMHRKFVVAVVVARAELRPLKP